MSSEFTQRPEWKTAGACRVTSELFLDVVFTSACDCRCPFCISHTREYAAEKREAWEKAVADAFRLFDIRNVIILGGEATIDPDFWDKLQVITREMEGKHTDHLILTTNGNRLRDPVFADKVIASRIDAVNLSRMHYDQAENDRIFGRETLTKKEIADLYRRLKAAGKTLRLNVNVWRGNLDTPEELEAFISFFRGTCDAVKLTPLMETTMFDTVPEVTAYTFEKAIPEAEIADLWERLIARNRLIRRSSGVLGFVDYAEAEVAGQPVILKYAQVEDKYDRETVIPTLKLYPNGCLSNEWSFTRDIRERILRN
ncbi:MAG: radical SAM protein [Clostridia bacterium]|nr:radical SAM protein [Clostridia bacterium]